MTSEDRHTRQLRLEALCAQRTEIEGRRGSIISELKLVDRKLCEIDKQISRLAPVYSLPDEVLLEIVEAAYVHDFPYCRNQDISAVHSPVAFSHVSRRFRRVALASTKIWTCIHASLGQPDSHMGIIQAHLAHSRDQPLSVIFHYLLAPPHDNPTDEAWEQYGFHCLHAELAWNLVLGHFHRWKHLAMFFGSMDPIVPYMERLVGGNFRLLESLYIWVDKRCTAEPVYEDGLRLNFRAPLLQKLSLCAEIFDVEHPLAIRNVTQLALCRMWKLTTYDVTSVLSHCAASLTYLEISGDYIFEPVEQGLDKVHLPKLRHLLIHSTVDEAWYPLLTLLDAPHLESLAVEDEESLNGFIEAVESGLFHYHNVRYLSISHTEEATPQKLRKTSSRFVRAFPSLAHLRVKTKTNKYGVMRQILGACRRPTDDTNDSETYLPTLKSWYNLRTLTLESPEIDEVALKMFTLQQRRHSSTFGQLCLRNAGEKPISSATQQYLETMGMTVTFTREVSCSRFDAYNWHSEEFIPWVVPVIC